MARDKERERGRRGGGNERPRKRTQYRFSDSGSFSIPSTIRTVDRKVRVFPPPRFSLSLHSLSLFPSSLFSSIIFVPRQLTARSFLFFSLPSLSLSLSSLTLLSDSWLPPSDEFYYYVSSSPRRSDIRGFESDVESALSRSRFEIDISSLSSENHPLRSSRITLFFGSRDLAIDDEGRRSREIADCFSSACSLASRTFLESESESDRSQEEGRGREEKEEEALKPVFLERKGATKNFLHRFSFNHRAHFG